MSKGKIILILVVAVIVTYTIVHSIKPSFTYRNTKLPDTFNEFYKNKLKISKEKKAKPKNEELLVRYSKAKTDVAILYIHGFKASRMEGQYIVDKVAKKLKANTYYMRLPGHGTNIEDHLHAQYSEYLNEVIDALFMMQKLGKKVVVIGTSTGGLLATYLAAAYPEKVAGIILASPFYDFASPVGQLMKHYPLLWLYSKINPIRHTPSENLDKKDNGSLYWYDSMYVMTGRNLILLTDFIASDVTYKKVTCPVLLFYYYKDEKHQDETASVKAMLHAFETIGTGSEPSPLNKKIQIKKGRHVLMCHLYETEWDKLENESYEFIKKIQ